MIGPTELDLINMNLLEKYKYQYEYYSQFTKDHVLGR